jgi:hypothetical protein
VIFTGNLQPALVEVDDDAGRRSVRMILQRQHEPHAPPAFIVAVQRPSSSLPIGALVTGGAILASPFRVIVNGTAVPST